MLYESIGMREEI